MKMIRTAFLCGLTAAMFAGCAPESPEPAGLDFTTAYHADGLMVGIHVPDRTLRPGETFDVTVIAHNQTDAPLPIESFGSDRIHLSVSRYTARGWEIIERHPPAYAEILDVWEIPPHAALQAEGSLLVSTEWPSGELLRIKAWVNGLPEASVAEFVRVAPREP